MDFIITILPYLYLTLILFYLWKKNPFKKFGIKSGWAVGIFAFKVIAGTALWAIYTYYYNDRTTSDAFRFYDDAKVIHSALSEDFGSYIRMMLGFDTNNPRLDKYVVQMFNWDKEYNFFMYNDNQTMLRFNAFCLLFSFGNYHVHTIAMSLFSFAGSLYLYKTFYKYMTDKKYLLLLAVYCIPSVALFSSGVLKEGIVVGAMGFFLYGVFNLPTQYKKVGTWICLLLGGMLLLIMKIYIIFCFVPALLYLISSKWIISKHPWLYYLIFNSLFFAGLILLSWIFPEKDVFYLLYKKRDDFMNVAIQYESGSYFTVGNYVPNAGSFLIHIPLMLWTVLFRPYIWEANSLFAKMAAFENIFILFMIVLRFVFHKSIGILEKRIFYFILTFVFYLYILIGFTTSVFGALVRYKAPALALVVIACLLFMNAEKLKKYTPFKNL
jgi:hypothetical protein